MNASTNACPDRSKAAEMFYSGGQKYSFSSESIYIDIEKYDMWQPKLMQIVWYWCMLPQLAVMLEGKTVKA